MWLDEAFALATPLIKAEEGWRSKPYICPAGYPTIGYGHRIASMNHKEITQEEGDKLLWLDMLYAASHALFLSPGLHDEPPRRLAALISFIFNLGHGNYKGSILRKAVDAENWPEAAKQVGRWVYARDPRSITKKVKLPGLVRRRAKEAALLYDPAEDG